VLFQPGGDGGGDRVSEKGDDAFLALIESFEVEEFNSDRVDGHQGKQTARNGARQSEHDECLRVLSKTSPWTRAGGGSLWYQGLRRRVVLSLTTGVGAGQVTDRGTAESGLTEVGDQLTAQPSPQRV
jgi:hypothetical protein